MPWNVILSTRGWTGTVWSRYHSPAGPAPPPEWLKINFDGSLISSTSRGGAEYVVRDHDGKCVRAEVSLCSMLLSPSSKWLQLEILSRLRSSVLGQKNYRLKVTHLGYIWELERDQVLMAMRQTCYRTSKLDFILSKSGRCLIFFGKETHQQISWQLEDPKILRLCTVWANYHLSCTI